MSDRRMPARINLGKQFSTTMAHCMGQQENFACDRDGKKRTDLRAVMGFYLPSWQRGLVWTERQKIAFIESAWRGVYLGTYTYNQAALGSPYDSLLIDGQQRMHAIECYLNDEFPVLGWRWSEVTPVDRRAWTFSTTFGSYLTETEDEAFLRDYYNLMNFGGVPHKESERA
jgi:hypothetical protein